MRNLRVWVLAALMAAALPASVGGAAATGPVALAGVNTITASEPVSVPVTIDEEGASVSCLFWESAVTFDGAGRFVALLLAPEMSDWESDVRPILWGRVPAIDADEATFDMAGCWDGVLSPGAYRLTLIPDGQPVTATLRIKGLEGATAIETATPDPGVRMVFPDAAISGVPGNAIWSAGSVGSISESSTGGMLFNLSWAGHVASAARASGQCQLVEPNEDRAAVVDVAGVHVDRGAARYGPSCAGSFGFSEGLSIDGVYFRYGYSFPVEPGRYGLGSWHAGAGVVDQVGAVSLFIDSPVTANFSSRGSGSGCCFPRS